MKLRLIIIGIILLINHGFSIGQANPLSKNQKLQFNNKTSKSTSINKKSKYKISDQQLIKLIDSSQGQLKCNYFLTLAMRKSVNTFPILLRNLYDTTTIKFKSGCVWFNQMVGDYFLNVVLQDTIVYQSYALTKSEQAIIDSILIFDKAIALKSKFNALDKVKPIPNYYTRIREISYSDSMPIAIVALSRFKNPCDLEIIKSLFKNPETEYYGCYAAKEFPDSTFYPLLVKIIEREWNTEYSYDEKFKMLFHALAQYPTDDIYGLFENIKYINDDYRFRNFAFDLVTALDVYPNRIFDTLKSELNLRLADIRTKETNELKKYLKIKN